MRLNPVFVLTVFWQVLFATGASAACLTFIDAGGHRMVRSSMTPAGTGLALEAADVPSDGVTVTFNEEGGYGILAGGKLDAFASDFLNLTPETLPKHVAALFLAADFDHHPLDEIRKVPETWSAILGSVLLLVLPLRRRL
ncbi:MAG: hypothetical protein EOP88_04220 [Verrucomicrobiaceae bacterium]|nr:MAG: hypothetical protein EOP88_04220 [Verrucomicrobiaceae bacterium]